MTKPIRERGLRTHSRRYRNTADATGTVRITVALVRRTNNNSIPGNMTRSIRIRGTQVSTVARGVERLVSELVAALGAVEAASGVSEDV